MDFMAATEWVKKNESVIKGRTRHYLKFTPYEASDFLQEAYESALIAALRCQGKDLPFDTTFWTVFKDRISVLIPNPETNYGSNSIPSNLCSADTDAIDAPQADDHDGPDIEAIFKAVSSHLKNREQQTLSLSLGMTDEGRLSTYEIAKIFGCSDFNVRQTLNRAFTRLKRLVEDGTIVVDRMTLLLNEEENSDTATICSAVYAARSPPY